MKAIRLVYAAALALPLSSVAPQSPSTSKQSPSRFGRLARPMNAGDAAADTVRAKWAKDTLAARLEASFRFCASAISRVDDAGTATGLVVHQYGENRPGAKR